MVTTNHTFRRQLGADALLLLVTLIWGSTFVMVKGAVSAYPVFPFLAIRFGLATLALVLVSGRRLRALGWRGWGAGALIGLFLLAGYAFQTLGLRHTSASKAGFITGLSVVLVPILSTVLLRRRPAPGAVIGVCMATIGLALLTLNRNLEIALGDLLVLACALSFALHIVAVSAFAPRWDPWALTTVQVATVALGSSVIGLGGAEGWPAPRGDTWFAAAFTGILATALAFTIQTAMQRFTTPTHTALIFAAEPLFAALFGVLLAGDLLTPAMIAGGILIVGGTVVGEIRWSQRTAQIISRFISPQYVAVPLAIILGLYDPVSWQRGLLWVAIVLVLSVGVPVAILWREFRRGKISDWHISNRRERLKPVPVLVSLIAPIVPLVLLFLFDGPKLLIAALLSALLLVLFNLAITVRWKISQHVSGVAATTTLLTATLGLAAAPTLLLIPLIAWARIKVGAHTVMQTIAGGLAGMGITLLTLRFFGLG
jgi:drug/metabolite transporter (DMT)-like permease